MVNPAGNEKETLVAHANDGRGAESGQQTWGFEGAICVAEEAQRVRQLARVAQRAAAAAKPNWHPHGLHGNH
jgi:hypothetical protein